MKVTISKLMSALSSLKDHSSASGGRSVLATVELAILRATDSSAYASTASPVDDVDRHVHAILFEISNAPGAITFLARRLSARLASTRDADVALKTLLLLHRLLRGGDRYFEQDLRKLWSSGDLKLDLERTAVDGFALRYSRFLGERMDWIINQAGKLEPSMPLPVSGIDSVLYRLSKSQTFLDRITDCLPTSSSSVGSDAVLRSAMSIILRESFRVYVSFCDDMEVVLGSMSGLGKPARALAVDVLRKACVQSYVLGDYYDRCKVFTAGKNLDYPSVRIFTAADVSSVESPFDESDTRSLFSGGMETRISTVWVEFDEDRSGFSHEGFEDCGASSGGAGAGTGTVTGGESSVKGKAMELL